MNFWCLLPWGPWKNEGQGLEWHLGHWQSLLGKVGGVFSWMHSHQQQKWNKCCRGAMVHNQPWLIYLINQLILVLIWTCRQWVRYQSLKISYDCPSQGNPARPTLYNRTPCTATMATSQAQRPGTPTLQCEVRSTASKYQGPKSILRSMDFSGPCREW